MIPVYVLLAFAGWTLVTLLAGVGVYRWARILTGHVPISSWTHDDLDVGGDFYKRAMRAHGNCVENLPVYASIVIGMSLLGQSGPWYDRLAIIFMVARILQTLTHLSFRQTNAVVGVRFSFFSVQLVAMFAMIGMIVSGVV